MALATLLRPVNEPLALLLLGLKAVGAAVLCASYLAAGRPRADESGVDVRALTGPQLDGLALLSVNTYRIGFVTDCSTSPTQSSVCSFVGADWSSP